MKRFISAFLTMILGFLMCIPAFATESAYPRNPYESDVELGYEEVVDYLLSTTPMPNWASDIDDPNYKTHGWISEQGLDLLRNCVSDGWNFYSNAYASLVKYGSCLPDIDENSGGLFVWHFYGPNGYSFDNNPATPTALDKFGEHFTEAIRLYRTNKSDAMVELGRSLHYIQDINEPHHASNITAIGSRHTIFENYADSNKERFALPSITLSTLNSFNRMRLDEIADDCADNARDYIFEAEAVTSSLMSSATAATLRYAQNSTAGVLYKFMMEVG